MNPTGFSVTWGEGEKNRTVVSPVFFLEGDCDGVLGSCNLCEKDSASRKDRVTSKGNWTNKAFPDFVTPVFPWIPLSHPSPRDSGRVSAGRI